MRIAHFRYRMRCPKCDKEWIARMTEEYGIVNFDVDEESRCSDCGIEGEEVRELDQKAS